ncbi:alpha/beta hydrolase [Marinicaulis aureus]|uniref:Alpha/beta hydrolase n=1 Tax=Hyphococcus aureus TaxID=2666033 RepID=A0ABW1KQQ7_9PROT
MPSIQAVLFNWVMKATFKSKPIHLLEAKTLRDGADALAPKQPPAGVSCDVVEGAVKGEWHRAENAEPGRTVLYIHGGGYVFGSPRSHRAFTYSLAKAAQAEIFSLEYRMAPEHPFPAAVDDAVAAYEWLLGEGRDPAKLVIGGDSAGGGLALALLLSIKARGLPSPAGALLLSPWTDLATTGASLDENEKSDAMFKKVYIVEGAKRYLAAADPKAPLASPLYADLTGLPPMLIFVSDSEVLRDDSTRLQERLSAAGVQSKLVTEKGLIHVWPIFPGRFPEAMKSIREAAAFIREKTEMDVAA